MENASKALIIAGAILLSILLISLGIMVYNNAKGTVNDANLDAEAIQAFNSKFTQYAGSQRGSALNSLVDTVIASNASAANADRQVQINGATATGARRYKNTDIRSVSFGYDDDTGCINDIIIPEPEPTPTP